MSHALRIDQAGVQQNASPVKVRGAKLKTQNITKYYLNLINFNFNFFVLIDSSKNLLLGVSIQYQYCTKLSIPLWPMRLAAATGR